MPNTSPKPDSPSLARVSARQAAKITLGFAIALLLVYALGAHIGWNAVTTALETAAIGWVIAAGIASILGLLVWSKVWQLTLRLLGTPVSFRQLAPTYLAGTFANYITPFGQAGGQPFIALVISQDTTATYEDSLASVVTADLLNLIPFVTFTAIGLTAVLTRTEFNGVLRPITYAVTAMAILIPFIGYLGWRYKHAIENSLVHLARPLTTRLPWGNPTAIRTRIKRFYAAIRVIKNHPRHLLIATAYSFIGWLLFMAPLLFVAIAIGIRIDVLLVIFIVPASTLAGITPTPGGLGGVEGMLVLLLVVIAGIPAAHAFGITILYRLTSYWLALVVGGIAAFLVIRRA